VKKAFKSPFISDNKCRPLRSNSLLVALAVIDILFFLFVLPHSLANFDHFGLTSRFRLLYFSTKMHLIAMANWCSATAIWLVIVICAERLIGVRSIGPPSSRTKCPSCLNVRDTMLVILIATGVSSNAVQGEIREGILNSGAITSYNHFSHRCIVKTLCHGTQVISKCFDIVHE